MAMSPKLAITIGMTPHGDDSQDEDRLDREQDHDGGDGDLATEAVASIIQNLHEGGPSAVRDLPRLISAFEDMCQSFMDRDGHALEEAASEARDVLHDMMQE